MRFGARLAFGAIAACAALSSRQARAFEQRFAGDEARVTIDDAGIARVEHAFAYRVSGGAPKGFDVNGVEPDAVVDPEAQVTIDGVDAPPGRVDRKDERALRVTFGELPRGTKRGAFVVHVRYAVDLAHAGELGPDGAMWRLAWTAPVAHEGYDDARVVLDLPAAPTEPRVATDDGATEGDGRVASLKRTPDRDVLTITRPHVARGEAAAWTARVDPRAFPKLAAAAARSARAARVEEPAPSRVPFAWLAAGLAGVAFGAAACAKSRAVERACEPRDATARAVLPRLGPTARACLAGAAFAAGVALEADGATTLGAVAVAGAMLAAAHRAPSARRAIRGPGQWLAIAPGEAFAKDARRAPGDLLDATTPPGRAVLALAALACVAIGFALRRVDAAWTWLAPLDATALAALFFTGTRAQLPPDRATAPAGRLARIHRALRRDRALRVAPWGRVPLGAARHDELRLLVLPRAAMPGVVGIEVAVAWHATLAGYAPETEVLVRVRDESAAAARIAAIAPKRRALPGRKPDERVVRLVPTWPTRAGTLWLVARVASALADRRVTRVEAPWKGVERRTVVAAASHVAA